MHFDQLLDFRILLLLFLHTLLLCHILLFGCLNLSILSGGQTVWILIRPDIMLGLIWIQTICKGYQQTTIVAPSGQRVKYKQLVDTTFWLKPWLKFISFGSNVFHLARVLATTNSEPCIWDLQICALVWDKHFFLQLILDFLIS